ncbi:hypothetical protein Tco_0755929, partial [Tanacetum coccineum]
FSHLQVHATPCHRLLNYSLDLYAAKEVIRIPLLAKMRCGGRNERIVARKCWKVFRGVWVSQLEKGQQGGDLSCLVARVVIKSALYYLGDVIGVVHRGAWLVACVKNG